MSTFSAAQTITNDALESFVNETKALVSLDNGTKTVNFIRFPREERLELPGADLEAKVQAFLDEYGEVFGMMNPVEELPFLKTEIDQFGFSHLFYQQLFQQVPVFGGDLRFHFDDQSRLSAVNGVYIPNIEMGTFPLLSNDVLIAIAKAHVEATMLVNSIESVEAMDTELFIFRDGLVKGEEGLNHLVLEVTLTNYADVLEYVYVDAIKGTVVDRFTGTHAVMTREVYESDFGNQVWQEGDAFPGSLTIWQRNEVEAAGHTYHFFYNAFGFESYDGLSAVMRTINNNPNLSCPNANWNGSTTNYCDGTASDDVIGHEWAHAYTSYTSQLIYAWQAGALNESYSDIWGEVIDLLNNYEDGDENLALRTSCNSSDRWMIGEDATAFGNPIRDMWDPTCKNDPGKVSDSEYKCGQGDNGGVHTNSGVNNHAFALLVDGGNYNGENISALGLIKTAHIFWRAQKYYLTSTSDFAVHADALEASCSDLVGIDLEGLSTSAVPAGLSGQMITVNDCNEVSEVIDAVEFRNAPPCNFAPLLTSNPPDVCPPEEYRHDVLVQNFESGLGDWNVTQIPQNPSTWEDHDWEVIDDLPDNRPGSGVYGADLIIGNCSSDLENGIIRLISPWITIPASASDPVKLVFDHYVSLENKWDGGNIKYKLNNGSWTVIPASAFIFNPYNDNLNGGNNDNPMAGQPAFTGADEGSVSGTWGQSQIDLSQLGAGGGDDIRFRWELGTDGCNGWDGWYLDDIIICHCETFLPISLTDFWTTLKNNKVWLNWQTAQEKDNAGFEIQRKREDGSTFEKIGWVNGHGDSQQLINYAFEDKTAEPGNIYYYRLLQIDFDGRRTFSNVVSLAIPVLEEVLINISPNPAQDHINLVVEGIEESNIEVEIIDVTGYVVFQNDYLAPGNYFIDLSGFDSGLYFVRITGGFGWEVHRLILQ